MAQSNLPVRDPGASGSTRPQSVPNPAPQPIFVPAPQPKSK